MTTTNKTKKTPSPPANTAMVFAIKFPDGTIAVCKGKKVVKVIYKGEKPDGWENQNKRDFNV